MADLKRVYVTQTEEIALAEMERFDEKWSGKYQEIGGCKIKCVSLRREIQNLRTLFLSQSVIR